MRPETRRRLLSVDRAVGRYSRALQKGHASCRAGGDAADQTENYRLARQRLELRAEQVKQVLYELGISPIQFIAYRNFSLHMDKLIRKYSDITLLTLARSAMDYWTAYGLRPDVLSAICVQVFNLEV